MTKLEMMEFVDEICEEEGYDDSPAYDLLYSECCDGRSDDDARKLIANKLQSFNK